MPLSQERINFINRHRDNAINDSIISGIPASIKMAQAILESANGKSYLSTRANNFFGIKAFNWSGETITLPTDEFINGTWITVNAKFRKYETPLQSFADHSKFLIENKRYKDLFSYSLTDYISWSNGLKKAGYATDPHYAIMLQDIIKDYGLTSLDNEALKKKSVKTLTQILILVIIAITLLIMFKD